jgi:antitoxin component YwqK of YwqJK toxin-antitoxin module
MVTSMITKKKSGISKLPCFFSLLSLMIFSSCTQKATTDPTVLKTQYTHVYGAKLSAQEWERTGQTGEQTIFLNTGELVKKTFKKGLLDGETTYTFPHSQTVQKKLLYENGKLISECFYETHGLPIKSISYEGSQREITHWYLEGSPRSIEKYVGRELVDGKYFSQTQSLESEVIDKEGIKTLRNEHGLLLSKETIAAGHVVLVTLYYPSGLPQSITPFVNGVVEGERKLFFVEGEPKAIEKWENGKQTGITIEFQNGQKYAEVPYIADKKQGIEKRFKDGVLVMEISWKEDLQHGFTRHYIGKEVHTDWYYEGNKVSLATFNTLSRTV